MTLSGRQCSRLYRVLPVTIDRPVATTSVKFRDIAVAEDREIQTVSRNSSSGSAIVSGSVTAGILNIHSMVDPKHQERTQLAHADPVVSEQSLTSHSTLYRSFRGRFLQARWPNQQRESTEGSQLCYKIHRVSKNRTPMIFGITLQKQAGCGWLLSEKIKKLLRINFAWTPPPLILLVMMVWSKEGTLTQLL